METIEVPMCVCGCPKAAHLSLDETNPDHAGTFGEAMRHPCVAGTAFAPDFPRCRNDCWDYQQRNL
jgi:hypothetical protein